MHYLIYKITNIVNNKIYIGKHKTENINDDYMGSGTILQKAIEKYGLDKFKKEILFECSNENEMNHKEKEIVNDEFVSRLDTYNIKLGGEGGFDYVNKTKKNLYDRTKPSTHEKYRLAGKRLFNTLLEKRKDKKFDKKYRNNLSKSVKKYIKKNGFWWSGKKHSPETIDKLKDYKKKYHPQLGNKNSQYGKVWIYNEILKINKSIKRDELDSYLNNGWKKGRKMKF